MCPRGALLGADAAQLPGVQEEALQDDRPRPGLRRGRFAPAVQGRQRDDPEGDNSMFVCLLSLIVTRELIERR